MRFKGTTILFILLVILGGYVYLTEIRGKEERKKQEEAKKKVFQVEQKDISEISLVYPDRTIAAVNKGEKQWEITSPAGLHADADEWESLASNIPHIDGVKIADNAKELEAQKSGDNWQLKKPVDTKADSNEVSSFVSSIRFGRVQSFPEPPVDAKTAGLDSPALKLTLHDGKAKTDRVLLIGKSPEKDKYYARDASRDAIFIMDKEIPEKARRPLFDWRDKTIVKLDREKLEKVEIQRGSENISLLKSGSDWKLADGKKVQYDKVSGMFNTLDFEKVKEIVDMSKTLAAYELDKPKLEVSFREGSNDPIRVQFGSDSKTPEGIYLKSSDAPAVKVVSKDVFDKFNVKPEDIAEAPPAPPTPSTPPLSPADKPKS